MYKCLYECQEECTEWPGYHVKDIKHKKIGRLEEKIRFVTALDFIKSLIRKKK